MNDSEPDDTNIARCAVNFDLGDGADVGTVQFISDVGAPAAFHDVSGNAFLRRGAFVPLRQLGQAIQHLEAAFIAGIGISYSQVKWVVTRRRSYLVKEAFVGERILQTARSPDPGGTEGRRLQAMANRLDVREFVADRRVVQNAAR